MIRNLKFRVWSHQLNKFLSKEEYALDLDGKVFFVEHQYESKVILQAIPKSFYTIQQFTGFQDENEKDIYEGDIVESSSIHITSIASDISTYTYGIIKFIDTAFKVCQKGVGATYMNDFITCNCCPCGLKVIGNIFENPDLIK